MRLRDVRIGDVDAYVRMRCDPAMMAGLGGPRRPEDMPEKVRTDVASVAGGSAWIKMIVPDDAPDAVAGTVTLWSHEADVGELSEIGWMVLPEFQGRGLAKRAVRAVLEMARDDGRWGRVHAFPGVTNAPSNGVCRSLGFHLTGEEEITFAGAAMRVNHWVVDPRTDPAPAG